MLTIWGRTSSINVRKVLWAAQEMGVAFEHIEAGGAFGVVRTPEFLAMNPNGMVPAIVDRDDGGHGGHGSDLAPARQPVALWESNVIVRYLFTTYGEIAGLRVPEQHGARFVAEQWMDWQQTTLNPAGRDAFIQLIRVPEAQRDKALIAASVAATEPLLNLLDAHLARQPFVAGDAFGMADIPLACEMHRWFGLPQPRAERPHLDRWYAGLLQRPAARGVLDLALS